MTKEMAPDGETIYDKSCKATREAANLVETGRMHVRSADAVFEESSHSRLKYYTAPVMEGSILPDWKVFFNEVKKLGGRHTHQGGGVIIFVLDGEGYSLCDEDRIDWGPGDLILLSVKPGGVSHQHFTKDPEEVCKWIAFKYEPFHAVIGDRVDQDTPRPGWELPSWSQDQLASSSDLDAKSAIASADEVSEQESLYWDLIKMRDKQREEVKNYVNVVKGKELEWEVNPQGKMKWYLHPSLRDRIQTFLFYVQEIPPKSSSGKQKHQGGKVIFILDGKGHSQIGDRTVNWGKFDYIGIPHMRDGITYQHFNDDPKNPARFIVVEPNFYPILGVDMGAGFEQIEIAPEYKK